MQDDDTVGDLAAYKALYTETLPPVSAPGRLNRL